MTLSGTLSGPLSGSLSGVPPAGDDLIDLVSALGSDLLYFWQVSDATVTRDGSSNASAWTERVAGTVNMAQGTAGLRPAYTASGGPNNAPYLSFQDVGRRMTCTPSISAGHRSGVYAVMRMPDAGALRTAVEIGGSNDIRLGVTLSGVTVYHHRSEFTGGDQALSITNPAFSAAAWHLHALRPLSTGALSQIDGVTTTPDVTGNDTYKAWALANVGSISGTLGAGDLTMLAITTEPVDAIDTIVRAYVAQEFAIT